MVALREAGVWIRRENPLGLPNLELVTSDSDFSDAIASMRRGVRPRRVGSSATG